MSREAQEADGDAAHLRLRARSPPRRTAIDRAIADNRTWLTALEVSEAADAAPSRPSRRPILTQRPPLSTTLFKTHAAVVAKIASPDIVHKSDVGGVELELTSPEAVREATAPHSARARAARPHPRRRHSVADDRRAKVVELIAGVADDPGLRPRHCVRPWRHGGGGGRRPALPPLAMPPCPAAAPASRASSPAIATDRPWIGRSLRSSSSSSPSWLPISAHPRDRPQSDPRGRRAHHHGGCPHPGEGGYRASGRGVERRHPRLAIRPYPSEWEQTLTLKDGHAILVRPLKPEDECYYPPFFARMTDELHRDSASSPDSGTRPRLHRAAYPDRLRARHGLHRGRSRNRRHQRRSASSGDADADRRVCNRGPLRPQGKGARLGRCMRPIIRFAHREGYRNIRGEAPRENTTTPRCVSLSASMPMRGR